MKKFLKMVCLLGMLAGVARADTQGNAALLGTSTTGPYTGNSTFTLVDQYNVTSSLISKNLTLTGSFLGNLNLTGAQSGTNETLSGYQVYTPVSQVTVSTAVPISATGSFMLVASTGGPVTFGLTSSYPAISTASAVNGQFLVLGSTTSTNNVIITTGTANAVIGDDASIVITSTKSFVSLIYSSTLSQWIEIGKQ